MDMLSNTGVKMNLNDRMKMYEKFETGRRFLPKLPVIARLDGRSFHSFTNGLGRPFDERLSNLMVNVTNFLVEGSNACIGYTQSDEISLVFYSDTKVMIGRYLTGIQAHGN
jgi:tRNA(His) guanylyltransferase